MTVADLLSADGHAVETAADGPSGLAKAISNQYDLIVLDIMLPGKNGFDVCRDLRQRGSDVAILMLTARNHVVDRVVGLKLGADDYMAKPFDPQELQARVEALLRRVTKENLTPVVKYQFGNVQVDFVKSEVKRDGQPVALAAKEIQLLRYLIDHRGSVLTRDSILSAVWEYQANISTRTVDVHIAWLRQKLEENPQFPKFILTVRGLGYRFAS